MPIITLTTDFSTRDGNVGVMKGVILGIAPGATLVDLSHDVEPQDIHMAAYVLDRHVFYFPQDSVHIVVVDPGVGTQRRPLAAQIGPQRFVGPDNGVFTRLYERAEREGWPIKVVHADRPEYWLPDVSSIFHGRDVFAPLGAHLATGVPLEDLGTPIEDPRRLPLPKPERTRGGWRGQVVHIDRFGNLASNIHQRDMAGLDEGRARVQVGGATVAGLVSTFGDRAPGELAALYGSTGYLIVSVVNGDAARDLNVSVGDPFEISFP